VTKLYNLMDDGTFTDLRELQRKLDAAVAAVYGRPASNAQDRDELVRRLNSGIAGSRPETSTTNPFNRADVTL